MKAANMRAQLVAQIAGQIAVRWRPDHEGFNPNIKLCVSIADGIVADVEQRLGEPIYKDRPPVIPAVLCTCGGPERSGPDHKDYCPRYGPFTSGRVSEDYDSRD